MYVDNPADLGAHDRLLAIQHLPEVVGDHLPGQVDAFDDVHGVAVFVDQDAAGGTLGGLAPGHRRQRHVGPLPNVAAHQGLQGGVFEELVAHRDQHVALVADRLKSFRRHSCRVAGSQLRLLVHVQDAGMFTADGFQNLLGTRTDHQQEPLETRRLNVVISRLMAGTESISKQTLTRSSRPIRVPLPAARMTTIVCSGMPRFVSNAMLSVLTIAVSNSGAVQESPDFRQAGRLSLATEVHFDGRMPREYAPNTTAARESLQPSATMLPK